MFLVGYPLVPWVAVMAAGFCFGRIYRLPDERRPSAPDSVGARAHRRVRACCELINIYGDPSPWSDQPSGLFTLLSFLRTTKYPPSLLFLLMTLGPAIALLGVLDRARPSERNPFLVFGRVPLFYFVLHIPLIHAVQIAMTWLRYGLDAVPVSAATDASERPARLFRPTTAGVSA